MPAFSTSSFVRLAAIVASAIAILAPLPASTQGNRAVASDRNIIETLAESGRFSTLLAAIEAAGLCSTLEKIESATLFAPSDRAFRRLPKGQLETLIAEPDALASLLSYHIVPGTLRSSALKNGALATLLENTPLEISVTRYWEHYISIDIDGTSVRKKDIPASNGLIHEIGSVLDPNFAPAPSLATLIQAPQFSNFSALLSQARLDYLLDIDSRDITVLAPTNAAFAKISEPDLAALINDHSTLRKALLNHIILRPTTSEDLLAKHSIRTAARHTLPVAPIENAISIGSGTITHADSPASNGLLHTIDTFLLPKAPQSLTSLVATTPHLTTFSAALITTGFAETLNSAQQAPSFTIFAPSNAAFTKLPQETLAPLLESSTGTLAHTLSRHVIRGNITTARLHHGQKLKTLSGDHLSVEIAKNGTITINGSPISQTDLHAANGVIHTIDSILQNEPFTLADLITSKSYLSTLSSALDTAGLTATLDDPTREFTLLAPLDSAFRRLPKGTLETLLQDTSGAFTDTIKHHVIPGTHTIHSLSQSDAITTLAGENITFSARMFQWYWFSFRRVTVNGASFIVTDIPADNGVLHVITHVLLDKSAPPES